MKNILFPTDFSEASNRAFVYALQIAKKTGAKITTLHAFSKPNFSATHMPSNLQAYFEDFDLQAFQNYKESLPPLRQMAEEHQLGDIEMVHAMETGEDLVQIILDTAKKEEADIIVMSTTGAEGLKEIFLGSVAGEVLENADIPVLAVPEEAVFDGEINKVAFTTSYKEEEKLAFKKLIEFQQIFDFEIHCINVDTAHIEFYTQNMDKLEEEFKAFDKVKFIVLEGNEMFEPLTKYMDEQNIDILAMTTRKRNFIQELFNFSRTKFLSYHSKVPVLSYQVHTLS